MNKSAIFHSTHQLKVIHFLDSLEHTSEAMNDISCRHLPVVDDAGLIVGMPSDRDLKRAMRPKQADFSTGLDQDGEFHPEARVLDYMSWPVATIDESESISQVAKMMIEKKVSSLIVSRNQVSVGIITTEDLLKYLLNEENKVPETFVGEVVSALWRSPVGSIAQSLANAGM